MVKQINVFVLCLIVLCGCGFNVHADENAQGLVMRNLTIFVLDKYGDKLNAKGSFKSSLPEFVRTTRVKLISGAGGRAMPMGLLTLSGGVDADEQIDVLLEFKDGAMLSAWPPAKISKHRMLWRDVHIGSGDGALKNVAKDSWLAKLRSADRLLLSVEGESERALLYDAVLDYKPILKVSKQDDAYELENSGSNRIHDVTFYRPGPTNTWTMGQVSALAGYGTQDAAEKDADSADQDDLESLFADEMVSTSEVAVAGVETNAPVEEAEKASVSIGLNESVTGSPALVLEPWRKRLAAEGFGSVEVDWASSVLEGYALDTEQATFVYRLDPGQFDELLPVDITPSPTKVIRSAIVVMLNAGPEMDAKIKVLIEQLGDPQWKLREAAQAKLKESLLSARHLLEEALKSDDLEIVHRAEQLLE